MNSPADWMISLAQTESEIRACYPVMAELRPQYSEGEYFEQVLRQQRDGYFLVALRDEGEVRAVAGCRFLENLAWGRFLYVDDLVTRAEGRSRGYGRRMVDWLIALARERGCAQFHLDSGVQRFGAHRFYLANRFDITSYHFAMKL